MKRLRTEAFVNAVSKGDPAAQFNVGLMYYYGSGIELNVNKGLRWMRKAARNGNFDAKFFLDAIPRT